MSVKKWRKITISGEVYFFRPDLGRAIHRGLFGLACYERVASNDASEAEFRHAGIVTSVADAELWLEGGDPGVTVVWGEGGAPSWALVKRLPV